MSFFKKLVSLFPSPVLGDERAYWIYARCNRCKRFVTGAR